MNRSSESGRGLPHSKTQARATRFRPSARSWTAPVLWRFGFRCKNGFMVPMRVQCWWLKFSMNRRICRQVLECGDGVREVTALAVAMLKMPKRTTLTQSGDSEDSLAAVQDARAPTRAAFGS
jgi:hypothetical protein